MFDPTVYDNLKVVLEGEVYDRDLSGTLIVKQRSDRFDLASLSREFEIEFMLAADGDHRHAAAITLSVSREDWSDEIAGSAHPEIGCHMTIVVHTIIDRQEQAAREQCASIREKLEEIWGDAVRIRQWMSAELDEGAEARDRWHCRSSMHFVRKINEKQIEDLPRIVDTAIETLHQL